MAADIGEVAADYTSLRGNATPAIVIRLRAIAKSAVNLGNPKKIIRLQARAADQSAVDIGDAQQLGGIVGFTEPP